MRPDQLYSKQIMQTYIRTVFADLLRLEGFISRDGEDLHWYRVVNSEIIQTIYFVAKSDSLALITWVGYGCHPLFTEPLFPSNIRIPNGGNLCPEIYWEYPNIKSPNTVFAENCPVLCPRDTYQGRDMLEDFVLSPFNRISSIENCYLFHRDFWFGKGLERLWGNQMLMPPFFDEAIYVDDKQVYERCLIQIERWEQEWGQLTKRPAIFQKYYNQMEKQKPVFQGEGRNEYVDFLINRANKNLRKIEQKIGTEVHCMRR